MKSYILLLSLRELILLGIAVIAVIIAVIVIEVKSRKRVRDIEELSEDIDMIWDLWYRQLEREADAKYKVYTTRGYADRLPERTSAILEDRELQQRLLKANSKEQRKALLREYLPEIMFPLVICKLDGFDGLSLRESTQLKQLMRDYGVKPLKKDNSVI